VSRLLEKRGYSVVTVTDGHEALAALEKESFDVVLMDVHMHRWRLRGYGGDSQARAGGRRLFQGESGLLR